MFEDAYAKHKHWHKVTYKEADLEQAVERAAAWAEKFVSEFADYQIATSAMVARSNWLDQCCAEQWGGPERAVAQVFDNG